MDKNQKMHADHIIEDLNSIEVDGETLEYVIRHVGMDDQMLKQLFNTASDLQINNLMEERESLIKDESLKVFWTNVRNTEHEMRNVAERVWNDFWNNETLIYNDFDSYWKDKK